MECERGSKKLDVREQGLSPGLRVVGVGANGGIMFCAYCNKKITEEEMKNGTFVSIREFKYGKKKSEMKFIEGGLSILFHRRCFTPSYVEGPPCKKGLVE